jgi:hypothetical protein
MPFPLPRRSSMKSAPGPASRLAAGRAMEWFEDWVSKRLANDGDAKDGIALLRRYRLVGACPAP